MLVTGMSVFSLEVLRESKPSAPNYCLSKVVFQRTVFAVSAVLLEISVTCPLAL